MGGYEIGLSGSAASSSRIASQVGGGKVTVNTGGAQQTQTLFIVAGVVVVAIVLAFLFRKRR